MLLATGCKLKFCLKLEISSAPAVRSWLQATPKPIAHSTHLVFQPYKPNAKNRKKLNFSEHSKKEFSNIGRTKYHYYFCENRKDSKFIQWKQILENT